MFFKLYFKFVLFNIENLFVVSWIKVSGLEFWRIEGFLSKFSVFFVVLRFMLNGLLNFFCFGSREVKFFKF